MLCFVQFSKVCKRIRSIVSENSQCGYVTLNFVSRHCRDSLTILFFKERWEKTQMEHISFSISLSHIFMLLTISTSQCALVAQDVRDLQVTVTEDMEDQGKD